LLLIADFANQVKLDAAAFLDEVSFLKGTDQDVHILADPLNGFHTGQTVALHVRRLAGSEQRKADLT
jgi:hypothetical protein